MRTIQVLLLLSFFLVQQGMAQKAEMIQGIAEEVKSIKYYEEQSKLWQLEIDKDAKNATAWSQLYKAQRAYLQLSLPEVWKNNSVEIFNKLDKILDKSKRHIGNTFDYHFLKGINTKSNESIVHLEKAYTIDPDRSEAYGWLLTYYIPLMDESKMAEFSKKMLEHNEYSNANLHWNYNALQTVAPNGVFISNGDMDGGPKFVLQYGQDLRKDVLVLSKWLLADRSDYRSKAFKKLSIAEPSKNRTDFNSFEEYVNFITAYVLKNSNRPVYMGCGTNVEFFEKQGISENMYLVGLAFKYSEKSFDNMAVLRDNFENKYKLEYLLQNFQKHHEDEVVAQMNLTYLPGLMKLKTSNSLVSADRQSFYNDLIMDIANKSGRAEEVLSWF